MLEGRSTSNVTTSFKLIITHQPNITTVFHFHPQLTSVLTQFDPIMTIFDHNYGFINWLSKRVD